MSGTISTSSLDKATTGDQSASSDAYRDFLLMEHGCYASGHAISVCNATTGHFFKTIAFCEKSEYAAILVRAANAHGDMIAALKHAQEAIAWYDAARFEIDGKQLGNAVDAAIAKAEGR